VCFSSQTEAQISVRSKNWNEGWYCRSSLFWCYLHGKYKLHELPLFLENTVSSYTKYQTSTKTTISDWVATSHLALDYKSWPSFAALSRFNFRPEFRCLLIGIAAWRCLSNSSLRRSHWHRFTIHYRGQHFDLSSKARQLLCKARRNPPWRLCEILYLFRIDWFISNFVMMSYKAINNSSLFRNWGVYLQKVEVYELVLRLVEVLVFELALILDIKDLSCRCSILIVLFKWCVT